MTAKTNIRKPVSTVITVPDPDETQFTNHAQQGGTVEWRSESPNYPKFEVKFVGPNPYNTKVNDTLSGSTTKPVVVRLKKVGEYTYTIRHTHTNGKTCDTQQFDIHIVPCPKGCPPVGLGI
jgi:hypothetical protein